MRLYNHYIITVASVMLMTTVALIVYGLRTLDAFYTAYVIEALIITELFSHFNQQARRHLNTVSIILFIGFFFIVARQVYNILT